MVEEYIREILICGLSGSVLNLLFGFTSYGIFFDSYAGFVAGSGVVASMVISREVMTW